MDVKNILFPTDFSDGSEAAAAYVRDLARFYGARVYVLHVMYDVARNSGWYGSQINTDVFYAELRTSADTEMQRVLDTQLQGCADVVSEVRLGTPYEDIVEFAREHKADMVVMGSHGRKVLNRMLFGSTALKVVKHAPCPVLTVRVPVK